jgi:hypothetical protein
VRLSVLDHPIDDMNFRDARMDEVIASLHDKTSANIVFNWHKTYGVDPSTPVNLHLKGMTLEQVLDGLVHTVGVHDYPIGWRVEGDLIVIAPASEVRELPRVRRSPATHRRDAISRGGGEERSDEIYPSTEHHALQRRRSKSLCRDRCQIELAVSQRLRHSEEGRAPVPYIDVREFGGRLIVTATPEVHRHVHETIDAIAKEGWPPMTRGRWLKCCVWALLAACLMAWWYRSRSQRRRRRFVWTTRPRRMSWFPPTGTWVSRCAMCHGRQRGVSGGIR